MSNTVLSPPPATVPATAPASASRPRAQKLLLALAILLAIGVAAASAPPSDDAALWRESIVTGAAPAALVAEPSR